MLVHVAPWVGPVVIDLAAQHVPADAPHVLVLAELREVVVAHADVVDVHHLEREVVEPGLLVVETEEHVVIDVMLAAVAAIERADQVVLVARINIIGADEAEHLAEPGHGLGKFRRHHYAVSDPLDV